MISMSCKTYGLRYFMKIRAIGTEPAPMSVTSFPKAPAKRTLTEGQPVNNRSRVTTGRAVFANADGRGPWGRRFRDLLHLHCDDLGGLSSLSECQLSLVRRMSALEIELERMEGELAEGRPVDWDAYGRLSGHLRRIVETLGLRRVKRGVIPDIHAYVSAKARQDVTA
jgi:hypothetical protein